MPKGTAVRLAGRITDWNDAKGFGFVAPNGGSDRAFVHASALERGARRPVVGDLVSYLPSRDARGRLVAGEVRHAGRRIDSPRAAARLPRAALGASALVAAAVLAVAGIVPPPIVGAVFGLSALAYVAYWLDKSAARRGAWRTPESTLHLVAMAGGWPGALIAQQRLRHKTAKRSFQAVFWATVALNVAGVAWLARSGVAAELVRALALRAH